VVNESMRLLTHQEWEKQFGDLAARMAASRRVRVPVSIVAPASPGVQTVHFKPAPNDVLAQCPKCKTVETLQFVGQTMSPARKFSQKDGRVYHDCGSDKPCRLHGLAR
jgi:hypothetical protein